MVTFTDVLNYYQNMGRLGLEVRLRWLVGIDRYQFLTVDESRVVEGSLTLERSSTTGEKLEIGNVISSELKFSLKNDDGFFDNVFFNSPDTRVSVFLERKDMDVNESYPFDSRFDILCSEYLITDYKKSTNVINITAMDSLIFLDKQVDWPMVMDYYNYSKAHEPDPTPTGRYIRYAIDAIASTLNLNFTGLPQGTNSTRDVLGFVEGTKMTYRTLLKQLAFLNCSNVFVDSFDPHYPNLLTVKGYSAQLYNRNYCMDEKSSTRKYISDEHNRYASGVNGEEIFIDSFTYTTKDGKEYTKGNETIGGLHVAYSGCDLMEYMSDSVRQAVVNNIFNRMSQWRYVPYEATVKQIPFLMPLDMITFIESRTGTVHETVVTNTLYKFNGNSKIAAKGTNPKLSEAWGGRTIVDGDEIRSIISDTLAQSAVQKWTRIKDTNAQQTIKGLEKYSEFMLVAMITDSTAGRVLASITIPADVFLGYTTDHGDGAHQAYYSSTYRAGVSYMGNGKVKMYSSSGTYAVLYAR